MLAETGTSLVGWISSEAPSYPIDRNLNFRNPFFIGNEMSI